MSAPVLHPAGELGWLLELPSTHAAQALAARLETHPLPGQKDLCSGERTVLVVFSDPHRAAAARTVLAGLPLDAVEAISGQHHRLEASYDGADLHAAASLLSLSEEALVAAHAGTVWTAGFIGFAPGFAYLSSSSWAFEVPRLSSPRTAVPAGAVALAGSYSAAYPSSSPGGWQLIARTNARLWDSGRTAPALICPGDTVQFVPVRELVELPAAAPATPGPVPAVPEAASGRALQVMHPGLQPLIQDAGRPGLGRIGVGPSGAADRASHAQANRLAGNAPDAATIEVLAGGLELEAAGDHVLALAGAQVPVFIDGQLLEQHGGYCAPFPLQHGQRLQLGAPVSGLRSYLAVRGGLSVEPVLGSRSTDTLAQLGPAPLAAGQRLPVGGETIGAVGWAEPSTLPVPAADGCYELAMRPGPREDWFSAGQLEQLTGMIWVVSPASSRVGLRLQPAEGGSPLRRDRAGELPSEPMATGAVQVPPNGEPVLFLADRPVTGGYPVLGVLGRAGINAAAQLPPGARVRLVPQLVRNFGAVKS